MTFKPAPIPENEKNRLLAVEKTGVLDVVDEDLYNVYCHLARKITNCPQSWANVIDSSRQYNFVLDADDFDEDQKSEARQNVRATSFCQYALNSVTPLIINDLTRSSIFKNHPSVLATDGPRFYAAFPLVNAEGYILGSLCVRDFRVRRLSADIVDLMKSLSNKLSHQLDLQTKQRSSSAEKIVRALEILSREYPNESLGSIIAIVKCFANAPLRDKEIFLLQKIDILKADKTLTKNARKLQQELNLDSTVLKRMKIKQDDQDNLKNLFKALN